MNSLNDFIEIFGLNINEGDIIKDKQGIEYKLSHIHTEKLDDHENDDLYKEGLGINGDSFELEHTFNEKDILKDDGIQYVKLDAVYEKDSNSVSITFVDKDEKSSFAVLEILGMENTFHEEFEIYDSKFTKLVPLDKVPKYGWKTTPVTLEITYGESIVHMKTETHNPDQISPIVIFGKSD